MVRFDWYQGTVRASPGELMDALGGIDACARWEPAERAPNGYEQAQRLVDDDGAICAVWWGSKHEWPHCIATGETAPAVADLLRCQFVNRHGVSRADCALDYTEPDAYERLQAHALGIAASQSIKVGTAGDHLLTKQGRTLYLGGTSSAVRLRLYDKAAELRAKFAGHLPKLLAVPEHLTRLEVQVRPQTAEAKLALAAADPVTVMGSARWTRLLMKEVADMELQPFNVGRVWRQSDDERAYRAVLAQYGAMFSRLKQTLGSWECVGLQIGSDLAETQRLKNRP